MVRLPIILHNCSEFASKIMYTPRRTSSNRDTLRVLKTQTRDGNFGVKNGKNNLTSRLCPTVFGKNIKSTCSVTTSTAVSTAFSE